MDLQIGNLAQWVTAGVAGLGFGSTTFSLFKRHWDDRAVKFGEAYKLHRPHLTTFWKEIRSEWATFLEGRSDHVRPEQADLSLFLDQLELPPPWDPTGNQISQSQQERRLSPRQELMWQFVTQIYPKLDEKEAVTAHLRSRDANSVAFHTARGELAWFWQIYPRGVLIRHIRAGFFDQVRLLRLLCWLETALARAARSEVKKESFLFKLARRL